VRGVVVSGPCLAVAQGGGQRLQVGLRGGLAPVLAAVRRLRRLLTIGQGLTHTACHVIKRISNLLHNASHVIKLFSNPGLLS